MGREEDAAANVVERSESRTSDGGRIRFSLTSVFCRIKYYTGVRHTFDVSMVNEGLDHGLRLFCIHYAVHDSRSPSLKSIRFSLAQVLH